MDPTEGAGSDSVHIARDYTEGHRQPFSIRDKWDVLGAIDAACYVAAAPWVIVSTILMSLLYNWMAALMTVEWAVPLMLAIVLGPAVFIGYRVHAAEIQLRDAPRIIGNVVGIITARTSAGYGPTGAVRAEPVIHSRRVIAMLNTANTER